MHLYTNDLIHNRDAIEKKNERNENVTNCSYLHNLYFIGVARNENLISSK